MGGSHATTQTTGLTAFRLVCSARSGQQDSGFTTLLAHIRIKEAHKKTSRTTRQPQAPVCVSSAPKPGSTNTGSAVCEPHVKLSVSTELS